MIDYAVYIGRFQPFHNGHAQVVEHALTIAKKVIVILGSAQESLTAKNPFTVFERTKFITETFKDHVDRITVLSMEDKPTNEEWASSVKDLVRNEIGSEERYTVGLTGFLKDDTEEYLKLFPEYSIELVEDSNFSDLSATKVRTAFFNDPFSHNDYLLSNMLPYPVYFRLRSYLLYNSLDYKIISSLMNGLKIGTCIFSTDENLNPLVITRRNSDTQFAMIGGKADLGENVRDAAIREFFEETGIQLDDDMVTRYPIYDSIEIGEFHTFVFGLYKNIDITSEVLIEGPETLKFGYMDIKTLTVDSPFAEFNKAFLKTLIKY